MKRTLRFTALVTGLCLMCTTAFAAKAQPTPTPPPVDISQQVLTPPEEIQQVLDIAYGEWESLNGKTLKRVNKYTEWRGKGIGFGWCGGYVTWCMMEAGIPMVELEAMEEGPVDGLFHIKEASVGKLLRGYQMMGRSTNVPQSGFLLVYGCSFNKTIHVALVYDVQALGGGKYRITTLEGNMANRVKMYVHDYDMNVQVDTNSRKSTNLSAIPEEEYPLPASACVDYSLVVTKPSDGTGSKYPYYVNCFLMPWVPESVQEVSE